MTFGVDIEPTNRCNAKCYFCPRDATPHQGLMTRAVFEQSLGRCAELRTKGVTFPVELKKGVGGSLLCYVAAPDGVSIELMQC